MYFLFQSWVFILGRGIPLISWKTPFNFKEVGYIYIRQIENITIWVKGSLFIKNPPGFDILE